MGQIITFYSYKGGVGRTMALANVGALLSMWGYKTLLIDWDLEAPGLENFFKDFVDVKKIEQQEGLLDFLLSLQSEDKKRAWQRFLIPVQIESSRETLHLLTAGCRNDKYHERVRQFDVGEFYQKHRGGKMLENFRNELKSKYDFILVDSRTGVTDVGGICTIQLPDILTVLFTATEQGVNGVKFIAEAALRGQQRMPTENRQRLKILPVATRIEDKFEKERSREWMEKFAEKLAPLFSSWLPNILKPLDFFLLTKVPNIPFYTFGENLPVFSDEIIDTESLGYKYENLAALLVHRLENIEEFWKRREEFVRLAQRNGKGLNAAKPTTQQSIQQSKRNVKIYFSYSHKQTDSAQEFLRHLKVLETFLPVEVWDDKKIVLGSFWDDEIKEALHSADIFLFFVTQDLFSSEWITKLEVPTAIELVEKSKGKKKLVPIWSQRTTQRSTGYSDLLKFQGLPRDSKTISESENQDKVIKEIVEEIENLVVRIIQKDERRVAA